MEVMIAVQSDTLLHALRVQLKRRVSARRGGGCFFSWESGRSGSEDDYASGVGYDPPYDSRHLDLGFFALSPSGFGPGDFRLEGSIGNCFTPPLCGSQGRCGSFLLRGA